MDLNEIWAKALKETEIIRSRVQALQTTSATKVPYVLLSESSINLGDTVVRRGEVTVEKPTLFIPSNNPQFEGFEWDRFQNAKGLNPDSLVNFLLIRGVSLPSLRYDNKTNSLNIYEGGLVEAIQHHNDLLQRREDVQTGLIAGPEDCWQFSLLIFICSQVIRNAETDIRHLLREFKKGREGDT